MKEVEKPGCLRGLIFEVGRRLGWREVPEVVVSDTADQAEGVLAQAATALPPLPTREERLAAYAREQEAKPVSEAKKRKWVGGTRELQPVPHSENEHQTSGPEAPTPVGEPSSGARRKRMTPRELEEEARCVGFVPERIAHGNHLIMIHPSGQRLSIPQGTRQKTLTPGSQAENLKKIVAARKRNS